MSTEHSPKDPVSLEDLKRAIEAVPRKPLYEQFEGDPRDFDSDMMHYLSKHRDAWRTAFEWREGFANLSCERERYGEYLEGMALIREKLR